MICSTLLLDSISLLHVQLCIKKHINYLDSVFLCLYFLKMWSLCWRVCVTWEHLCAVLQYLTSEVLPGPHQLAEETPYICELTARGVECGESRSQGLLLLDTHIPDTHKKHTHKTTAGKLKTGAPRFCHNKLTVFHSQMAEISEHLMSAVT